MDRTSLKITNKSAGFTLIELMIVISIVSILATLALPKFDEMKERVIEKERDIYIQYIQNALHHGDSEDAQHSGSFHQWFNTDNWTGALAPHRKTILPGFPDKIKDRFNVYVALNPCTSAGPTCVKKRLLIGDCVTGTTRDIKHYNDGTSLDVVRYAGWYDGFC